MRALIYTASAFFIGLAGLLGFYAFQPPIDVHAARVVLSIDVSKMPKVADSWNDPPLYADEEAKSGDGAKEVVRETPPAAETASDTVPPAADQSAAKEADQSVTGTGEHGSGEQITAEAVPTPGETGGAEPKREEAVSLPGAVIAGVDELTQSREKRPAEVRAEQPEETRQTEEAAQAESSRQAEETGQAKELTPTEEPKQVAAAPEIQEPQKPAAQEPIVREAPVATNLSTIEDPLQAPQDATQSPQETTAPVPQPGQEARQQTALPPPPLPARRPANIPPPVKVAAINGTAAAAARGWTSRQIPTTEAVAAKQGRVAILLRGVGQDRRDSADAIAKLPSAVSLGLVPVGDEASEWAARARAAGHEVIVQLPLEPTDYPASNPGPDTLMAAASRQDNAGHLKNVLGRFQGYTGVTNYMGSKLLRSREALKPILEEIKARDLAYIGAGNSSHAVVRELAQELKMRYANVSIIIDIQPTPDGVKQALDRLVRTAQAYGSAIGMAHASATTIEQIQLWSETLASRGVTLVPAGTLAQTL